MSPTIACSDSLMLQLSCCLARLISRSAVISVGCGVVLELGIAVFIVDRWLKDDMLRNQCREGCKYCKVDAQPG